MTLEQQKLHDDLIAEYGETIVHQARHLSGLTTCMAALGAEELSKEERERAYRRAALHLGELLGTVLQPEVSAKVTECAERIDTAADLWMADEIEKRDGLPKA
jgi:hypothetical protein